MIIINLDNKYKGVALRLKKKHEFPSHKNVLWQVWMELVQWFGRRRFLNIVNVFSSLPPFGKGWGLSFEQNRIHFTQGCHFARFVYIEPLVLEKKMKMWKVYRETKYDRQSEKLTWAFSSGELKTDLHLTRPPTLKLLMQSTQMQKAKHTLVKTLIQPSDTREN